MASGEEETGFEDDYGAVTSLWDWGQAQGRFFASVLPVHIGPFRLGVTGGYEYFYWYEYRYRPSIDLAASYYDFDVDAGFLGGVFEVRPIEDLFVALEPAAFFFSGGTGFGLGLTAGYAVPITGEISLPAGVRTGIVYWDRLVPIQGFLGIAYEYEI